MLKYRLSITNNACIMNLSTKHYGDYYVSYQSKVSHFSTVD